MDSRHNLQLEEEDGVAEKSPDGRFIRYDEILGSGACKVAYKGFDEIDGIEIAWNKISIDDDVLQSKKLMDRVLSEAGLAKSLKHENIIKCYCYWLDHEEKYINMITELCTSGSLREYRLKHKNVDMKAIKNWARQILNGLDYLHAQNPPVVHRDLKSDNVFVNGSKRELKIGDLGFAMILQQGTMRTVIGTPEFMAPKQYDDEYSKLLDICAFGMCMLELVTCEFPCSECKNACQVYKKVLSGSKPAALSKVKDPQAREFIEKCLVPASHTISAIELLKDPFLCVEKPMELLIKPNNCLSESENVLKPESRIPVDLGSNRDSLSSNKCTTTDSPVSSSECGGFSKGKEYRLKGNKIDENSISITLSIIGFRKDEFSFTFDLKTDTSLSIARELVELDLEKAMFDVGDVGPVIELMDALIKKFVPSWKPSNFDGVCNTSSLDSKDHCSEEGGCSVTNDMNILPFTRANGVMENDPKPKINVIYFRFLRCCQKLLRRKDARKKARKRSPSYLPVAVV